MLIFILALVYYTVLSKGVLMKEFQQTFMHSRRRLTLCNSSNTAERKHLKLMIMKSSIRRTIADSEKKNKER